MKIPSREKFERYSKGWETIGSQEPRVNFRPWEGSSNPPSGSLPAQVAHKLVSTLWPEQQMQMHQRLLEAYFSENRTISDWKVLAELVSELGEDSSYFLQHLEKRKISPPKSNMVQKSAKFEFGAMQKNANLADLEKC